MVKDDEFEMHAGAEDALQASEEHRIVVEVLTEVRARLLGVDETDFPPLADEVASTPRKGRSPT